MHKIMNQIFLNNIKDSKLDLNLGWIHYWDEPLQKKLFLKEYIKGPYKKAVLMFSDPYVTVKQPGRNEYPLEIRNGIPDPWMEYIIFNYLAHGDILQPFQMFKEDLNVVNTLRKRYRLYLGQGIPDPCLIHPYINRPELSNNQFLVSRSDGYNCDSHKNFSLKSCKKKHCFCCEKKYLFECPDNWDGNLSKLKCLCQNCHLKTLEEPENSELCEICTQVYNYDEAEDPKVVKSIKKQDAPLESHSNVQKNSQITTEIAKEHKTNLNEQHVVKKESSTPSGAAKSTNPSERILNIQSSEKKFRVCCCPYIRSSNRRKVKELPLIKIDARETQVPSTTITNATLTKEIQTDPTKYSKQIQTDQMFEKSCKSINYNKKCECTSKCPFCCVIQCKKLIPICPNIIQSHSDEIVQFQKCPLDKVHHIPCSGRCMDTLRSMLVTKPFNKRQNPSCSRRENVERYEEEQQSNSCGNNLKLKTNRKMYCCTFSSGFSSNCINHTNKSKIDRSRHFEKEPTENMTKNKFVYHFTPTSVSSKMANYLNSKAFNLNLATKPLLSHELKQASEDFTGFYRSFGKHQDDGLKNFRNFQRSNRLKTLLAPAALTSPLKDAAKREATLRAPLEVKYLNDLKSDESKTYGLINTKKRRRRGKSKTICKNSKPLIMKVPKRIRKYQKTVEVESGLSASRQKKKKKEAP